MLKKYWNLSSNKGDALYNLKKYNDAILNYDKSLEIDPNIAYVYNNKGNALRNLNMQKEAIQCYDKAIQLDPNYNAAINNKNNLMNYMKNWNYVRNKK